ncbi:hypothetical protein ACQY0O_004436 [Thecaphora frezii]
MAHHLTTFPFENTSLHYEPSHSVVIDPQAVFDRFVPHKKGGYCMQQNLLLLNVLRALGYKAYSASGRVCEPPAPASSPFSSPTAHTWTGPTHMVIFVLLPPHTGDVSSKALYLVDVGFGSKGLMRPMLLRQGHCERGRGGSLQRVIKALMPTSSFQSDPGSDGGGGGDSTLRDASRSQYVWMFQTQDHPDAEWMDNYSFSTQESFASDYQAMNFFTSTNSKSIFTKTLMVVRFTIQQLPGGDDEAKKRCKEEGLYDALYPYHPSQIAQDILFFDKVTRKPGGADFERPQEVIQLQDERQRIALLKSIFHLLPDIGDEEALRSIQGRASELFG